MQKGVKGKVLLTPYWSIWLGCRGDGVIDTRGAMGVATGVVATGTGLLTLHD